VGGPDRFFYLVKPFDPDELIQLAVTLINRWHAEKSVSKTLVSQASELARVHAALDQSEAQANELKSEIDRLLRQLRDSGLPGSRSESHADSSLETPVEEPSEKRHRSQAQEAAFLEGRAATNNVYGVGFCPYSAVKEADLFAAWIEGYRSVRGDILDAQAQKTKGSR
jgi:hypothetical protein